MKLSDKSFNYLFKTIASKNDKKEIIKNLFRDSSKSYFEGEFKLTGEIDKELQKIANEFDSDYRCILDSGEDAEVCALFHYRIMYIRLPGDREPYDVEEYEDVIGEWTINLLTKEVEFSV